MQVKFIADAKTDKILGCHIMGASAGELIHEVSAGQCRRGGSGRALCAWCMRTSVSASFV